MPDRDGTRVPDIVGVRDDVRSELITFVRSLRHAGVDVPANAAIVATRALVEVGFGDQTRARTALRAVLVGRPEDVDRFDRAFEEFWNRLTAHLSLAGTGESEHGADDGDPPGGHIASVGDQELPELDGDGPERDDATIDSTHDRTGSLGIAGDAEATETETVATATYSPSGQPKRVSVTLSSAAGDEELLRAVDRLSRAVATERGRRWRPTAAGERADVRRSLRRSISTGGAILSVPKRRRTRTASRVLVLADVSRSVLDVVDRSFLLRWLRALRARARNCRVFLFDTDIREVTAALDSGSTRAAVEALRDAETAWGGGTRIGHAVTTIRDEYADAVDRRTTVLMMSDGLEMGDVSELESGMVWLSRRAATVLWLNPLAAAPDYEPSAAGIAAALPSVDGLFAFTGPDDLTEMARQLTRYGRGGAIGYEHDPRRGRRTQP